MFNLIVLILVTIVFLMFGYLITHADIFSPFCVFCEMFLIAEFLCLFFVRMYKVEIHLNTILVIALGMISFGIVSVFFNMKRVDVRNYGEQHSRNYISINYLIQLVFLILEVLVVFYHAKYIKDVVAAFGYSTSSIFDIAGKYHVIALFNYNNFIEKAVSASFIYRHGIVWITAYAYVLLYILINNLAVKKKIEIIQIIYLGIYAFDQMLSGGRTALFRMITAILIITVICFGLNKRRNFTKLLFKIVGIIFGIILLLIGINMLLNRTGENSTLNLILESIYVYIGAPIQNLDTYLQGTRHTPELWGILVVNEGTATIDYVPSRNNSRVAKAPQSFWLDDILKAHEKALSEGEKNCIDSCTMMQRYGYDLYLIDGPGENIKITTPEDFYTMRAILEAKENEQIYGLE